MNKPKTFKQFDAEKPNFNNASRVPANPRWFGKGECFMLSDNTILEVSTDSRGCFIYAQWLSVKDFYNHKPHQYQAVTLEQF